MIEFICGNANQIPFPDQYFTCCITSPPYWSLRDYGTARWEGGDPDCDHQTGRFEYPVSEKQKSNPGSAGHQARVVCPKCGAVRIDNQLGQEDTPEEYVAHLVEVCREIWRALRDDGVFWLNLGDSYIGSGGAGGDYNEGGLRADQPRWRSNFKIDKSKRKSSRWEGGNAPRSGYLKPKDLACIPWRVAIALQADGWWLRSAAPWPKRSSMPESAEDRPSSAVEYVFQLTKSEHYYFDHIAVRRDVSQVSIARLERGVSTNHKNINGAPVQTPHTLAAPRPSKRLDKQTTPDDFGDSLLAPFDVESGRNWRNSDLWFKCVGMLLAGEEVIGFDVKKTGFKGAHFATFPPALVEPCLLSSTSEKGCCPICGAPWKRTMEKTGHINKREPAHVPNNCPTKTDSTGWKPMKKGTNDWRPTCDCGRDDTVPSKVLDPFSGAGTVAVVAAQYGIDAVGIDLNLEYIEMSRQRLNGVQKQMRI